ncbi:uncharacterized protein LOC143215605 [Lasioglossum baleicum]|uniref:uncharacterized protein LOC143215605 n=1 Tax=Lasioglossum baleicum TaxID=434251 RepID=UPI003FCD0364
MTSMEKKIKKWILLMQAEKLDELIEDMKISIRPGQTNDINKHIFKLLLYLSHIADKNIKENCAIGTEIYRVTCLLCQFLTEIPDHHKFASSLFHIVRCLLTVNMYKEAFKVCCFVSTEVLGSSYSSVSDILEKIAYLWHIAVSNKFKLVQRNTFDTKYYYELKEIVKHELQIIQILYKNYTKHLLTKISSYLDKIVVISEASNVCFIEFCTFVIEYLRQTELFLEEDEKHVIFRDMLHILSRIICENVNKDGLDFAIQALDNLSSHFKVALGGDKECYECYELFELFCSAVVKPVDHLVESDVNNIRSCCTNYKRVTKKYSTLGSVKWITFSIVQILELLFVYWEACLKTGKEQFLKNGLLLEIMNLIVCTSEYFAHQTFNKCKVCQSKECMVRRDIYNAVAIKSRCINLICKLSANNLSMDIYRFVQNFLEQNVAHIYEMKECKCTCWSQLWSMSGAMIYNLSIVAECFYQESVSLLSLLCTSVLQFEGIQQKSVYINLEYPISSTLHRLSSLHYKHAMYREAMTASALNALLSYNYPDTKAFRMWANIKHKSISNKNIMDMTMLSCLKSDRSVIEELGLSIELSQYNLIEICLREAKGLQEAKVNLSDAIHKVLDEMLTLKATPVQYARVVQMLAYHLLHFDYNENTLDCLKQAISNLKQIKTSNYVLCLQANLEFYIFVTQLYIANKKTQIEMENTKFALYAPRISEMGENDPSDVVPAYTMINMKEDSRLMMYLETSLKKWNKCIKKNVEEIVKGYEHLITLHTLIVAGEYARLYRYEKYEINIWKLVYTMASELQNDQAIIYVTGRSISSRYINENWITTAKKLADKFKDTKDAEMIYAIAVFWISLSDLYFERDMHEEARRLLDESRKLPGVSFISNIAVYLYSLDRLLYNCSLYKKDMKHEEYTRYIVETLYSLVNLNEALSTKSWKLQDKHLFSYDILLSATINLSLRMNSLLSFREICAHLVRRLKTAQSLGATMRVAEVLKSLCYIDLSRSQLHDCEIKLQGLEHILNIETFKASMSSKPMKVIMESASTPIRVIEPIRDIPRNDASPALRNKCFDLPEFMRHQDCNCYMCQNLSCSYLIFASTHIRAQLYALQNNFEASLQHFTGAFKIKKKLMKTEKHMSKDETEHFSWQERLYSTDYILLLINFCVFSKNYLKVSQERRTNILLLAIQLCDVYKLNGHPVFMSAKELLFDYNFQKIIDKLDYSTFTVPNASNIDTLTYVETPKAEDTICVTPTVNNIRTKKPTTVKQKRNPPLLKLNKVSINFSDDEDDIFSPKSEYRRTRSHSKLTRRKIFSEEYSDDPNKTKEEINESRNSSSQELSKQQEENVHDVSIKDMVNKVTSLVPGASEYLHKFADELEEPATSNNIQKLIKKIEALKVNAISQKATRTTRHSKQIASIDSTKIDEVIALFKDLKTDEQKDNNGLIKNEINSVERFEENNLCVKQCSKIENLRKIHVSENSKSRTTKKSVKQNIISREAPSTKVKKSK